MTVFILAYLGGVLTILSPCILPILPFVFARTGESFWRNAFPLLLGMAATFVLVGSIATIGGGWIVAANQYGRAIALIVLGLFSLTLISETLATRISQPIVALAGRMMGRVERQDVAGQGNMGTGSSWRSFFMGIATGLLWAPCAGPILGLILTGAALQGASLNSGLLLAAYAAGAATILAIVLQAGGRVAAFFRRGLGAEVWLRRLSGVAVLAAVVAIGLGLDRGVLTELSTANTNAAEQWLVDRFNPPTDRAMTGDAMTGDAMTGDAMTGDAMTGDAMTGASQTGGAEASDAQLLNFTGAISWLNSPPLSLQELKGKVVLVDFWTYSCINCLRSLPYLRAWADAFKNDGLVIVGVHAPEFAFERDEANVKAAVADLGITYPVAIDNDYAVWRAFDNQYWPAHYLFDATGKLRYHHFGEGNYTQTETVIRGLLAERSGKTVVDTSAAVAMPVDAANGTEMAADVASLKSPETYLGYARAEHFTSQSAGAVGIVHDQSSEYTLPDDLVLNDWGISGDWSVGPEKATLAKSNGRIAFKFHARDLHLVLGAGDKPVRFKVSIDGKAPGDDHGVDIDVDGNGIVTGQRLYQLVRQQDAGRDRVFEIEFLDPGVDAYSFTFG